MRPTQLIRVPIFICTLTLISYSVLAQQSIPVGKAPDDKQQAQDSTAVLEYAKFLREEEKSHREYLEALYSKTFIVGGALAALIAFFQWKTKKDVRDAVEAQFRATVEKEAQQSIKEFRNRLIKEMDKITRELKDRAEAVTSEVEAFVFAAMPSQVESVGIQQKELDEQARQLVPEPVLAKEEEKILNLMNDSKYSFRSLGGIAAEAKSENMSREQVSEIIKSLTARGLLGKTLGKKGGERWFITEGGRRHLMPVKDET